MQIDVDVLDEESKGTPEEIVKALSFDLVKPIGITGHAGNYNCEVDIRMQNGDVVSWYYTEDFTKGVVKENCIFINGETYDYLKSGGGENMIEEIRKVYKEHLQNRLGVKS